MSNTNTKENFFDEFELLTKKQKAVWRYLQAFSMNYKNVFPSQETIAKKCKCHRDTVIKTLKKFKKFGWIEVFKRTYTSNLYFICSKLLSINTFKGRDYKKPISIEKNELTNDTSSLVLSFRKNVFEEALTKYVQNLLLSKKDIEILIAKTEQNPESMQKAVKDSIALEKREKVQKPIAVIVSRFKHHSEKVADSEEVKHLDIPDKDKSILSSYNSKDRSSFLLAYEDFKSYSMIKFVGNISAFITSRFKAHRDGENVSEDDIPVTNREYIKEISPNLLLPKGVKFEAYNNYVELSLGSHARIFEYDDPNFTTKLIKTFRKWNVTKKHKEN